MHELSSFFKEYGRGFFAAYVLNTQQTENRFLSDRLRFPSP